MEDYFEEEANDELRRLQELTEIANNSDQEEEQEDEFLDADNEIAGQDKCRKNLEDTEQDENISFMLSTWNWQMNRAQRLEHASKFLRSACRALKKINKISENHLVAARRNCAEAGAHAFRNARIVGATVVGASRRLEAIRAAEPFAIVVEEACEVIEPTLMSVLAVKSLKKLELIGDHRQLPAFVQQCWFNFETTIPSIKTSLFERLISGKVKLKNRNQEATAANLLPYTILDEQRRMRSSIADITRPEYKDIVEIIDNKQTHIQRIGDVVIKSCVDKVQVENTKLHRALWPEKGRFVPGSCKKNSF